LIDAPEAAMKDARDNATRANTLSGDAVPNVVSEERREIFRNVQEGLRTYGADLDKLRELSATWFADRAKLFSGGDALSAATEKLVGAARASSDPAAGEAADHSFIQPY